MKRPLADIILVSLITVAIVGTPLFAVLWMWSLQPK